MDLFKAITALQEEKRRIDLVIEHLQALQSGQIAPGSLMVQKRRGRKSMSEEEKAIVSERMKTYWESRRNSKGKNAGGTTGS